MHRLPTARFSFKPQLSFLQSHKINSIQVKRSFSQKPKLAPEQFRILENWFAQVVGEGKSFDKITRKEKIEISHKLGVSESFIKNYLVQKHKDLSQTIDEEQEPTLVDVAQKELDIEQSKEGLLNVLKQRLNPAVRCMLFIDGSWLMCALKEKSFSMEQIYHIFVGLPNMITRQLQLQVPDQRIEVAKVCVVGNTETPDFYAKLTQKHFDVKLYEVRFDATTGKFSEKGVDISLAVELIRYAIEPFGYTIGIIVTGDADFGPALHFVREKGKKICLASAKLHCSQYLRNPVNQYTDFDIIWIDKDLHESALDAIDSVDQQALKYISNYIDITKHVTFRSLGRHLILHAPHLYSHMRENGAGLREFIRTVGKQSFALLNPNSVDPQIVTLGKS